MQHGITVASTALILNSDLKLFLMESACSPSTLNCSLSVYGLSSSQKTWLLDYSDCSACVCMIVCHVCVGPSQLAG